MMDPASLRQIIEQGETFTVEFKGEERGPLPDNELIETVVCLANGQGGTLLIGVEDDGTVTDLHPRHRTHPGALAAFVASRTVPPLTVKESALKEHVPAHEVAFQVLRGTDVAVNEFRHWPAAACRQGTQCLLHLIQVGQTPESVHQNSEFGVLSGVWSVIIGNKRHTILGLRWVVPAQ